MKLSGVTLILCAWAMGSYSVSGHAESELSNKQPVIDMHMHAYSGVLGIPNPNTGKLMVRNADEHRIASLSFMEKHHVVLGAVSTNDDPETAFQVLDVWERDLGKRLLRGLFFGKKAGFPPVESVRVWISSGQIDFLVKWASSMKAVPLPTRTSSTTTNWHRNWMYLLVFIRE